MTTAGLLVTDLICLSAAGFCAASALACGMVGERKWAALCLSLGALNIGLAVLV